MSSPRRRPVFQSYTPRSSGDVQTGEIQQVRGGGRCATIYSGAFNPQLSGNTPTGAIVSGGQILFYSGGGRLNSIQAHVRMVSGTAVTFYDSAVISLSGVSLAASGMKIIGTLPSSFNADMVSGVAPGAFTGAPINVDLPFQSGLCAQALSGAPGFTISFTPEASILDDGAIVGA